MRASEEAVALPRQLQGLSQETVMLGPLCPSLLWYESHHLPTQVRKDTGLLSALHFSLSYQMALEDS